MPDLNCPQLIENNCKNRPSDRKKVAAPATRPSRLLDAPVDPILDLLEQLDDVIFEAIRGCTESLAKAESMWPKTISRLGWEAVEESREQYLRYALDVVRYNDHSCPVSRGFQSPEQSRIALGVIGLLMRME
jgi:hypothetical protein